MSLALAVHRPSRLTPPRVGGYAAMVIITFVFMLPVLHALTRSVGPPDGLGNYLLVMGDARLPRFYLNSVLVSVGTIALTVTMASLAAFAFSKLRFPGQHLLFYTLLVTLLVPVTTLIVPLFVLIRGFGLYNTLLGLILPQVALGVPFYTVLIKNQMDEIPSELVEAGRIDGATNFAIFRHIMLPLSVPIQAVVITLVFLYSWNNYLLPLVLLKDESLATVPIAAASWARVAGRTLIQFGDVSYPTLFAALFLLAAPTVILFLVMQRWFIAGIVQGAIKS